MSDRDCSAPSAEGPAVTNLPGQHALRWRVTSHPRSLAAMRQRLSEPSQSLAVRSLADQDTSEPAVALLDAWATVADIVAFYTERIAQEGFLRTATERDSVRHHARTLGYELRPGVAAQVDLAFEVETAPGAPAAVVVPARTPVQTVPAPEQLPQTFETSAELEARGDWNAVPAASRAAQPLGYGVDTLWLDTTTSPVRVDDHVLVVGRERRSVPPDAPHGDDHEKWDFRRIVEVAVDPPYATGWTRLTLHRRIGFRRSRELVATDDVRVHHLTRRLNVFGYNAPDRGLLDPDLDGWDDYVLEPGTRQLELDGDVAAVVPGSWLVLEQPGHTEAFQVSSATPDGATKFALSGKLTRVLVDISEHLDDFERNRVLVHAGTDELPAAWMPRPEPVGGGHTLELVRTEPLIPAGRLVIVSGIDADSGAERVESATVVTCQATSEDVMTLTLEPPLAGRYHAGTVRVCANAVTATHGETVAQVLGSGDGRTPFPRFTLRRAPLTYVRTTTSATGAAAELEVRVEDVAWAEVPSLDQAGPGDQVFVVRHGEDGETTVVFGDGRHGARVPTGAENIAATYRVGIGAPGEAEPDQVRLPVRKPRGIAGVANPAASRDWAPEETLEEARTNAPQHVRTLDRAVSVQDYEDFARSYAGIGAARADLVWDGQRDAVVLSVLSSTQGRPSEQLLGDLRTTLEGARELRAPRLVLAGEPVPVGAHLRLRVDPRYETDPVLDQVRAALGASFATMPFATPLAASAVLVVAAGVPGVRSVAMPRLSGPARDTELVVALSARFGAVRGGGLEILAAQALQLADDRVVVEVAP